MQAAHPTSRRDFLGRCLTGAAVLGAHALAAEPPAALAAKSRVVVARDPLLRGAGATVDSGRMEALLDRAMQALFERDSALAAWKQIVHPGQRVSLKVNTLGGRGMATNLQLVEAVCERLRQAGVQARDIVVWDRDSQEMERAGYRIAIGGDRVQCFGTDRVGYEDDLSAWGSVGSQLSRILTRRTDLLINLPVLKDHDGAGVTLALKNMYGAIHNPNKYHPNGCDPYVADLNMLPEIRGRMRLVLCDATTAQYEGGPGYKPEHCWRMNGLLAARDPVALDTAGWQLIESKRAEKGLKTLAAEQRAPRYLTTAADPEHRLGQSNPRAVAMVEI